MLASFKDGDHPNNSRTRGFSNGDKNPEPSAAFARTLDWLDGEDNIQWVSLHGNSRERRLVARRRNQPRGTV